MWSHSGAKNKPHKKIFHSPKKKTEGGSERGKEEVAERVWENIYTHAHPHAAHKHFHAHPLPGKHGYFIYNWWNENLCPNEENSYLRNENLQILIWWKWSYQELHVWYRRRNSYQSHFCVCSDHAHWGGCEGGGQLPKGTREWAKRAGSVGESTARGIRRPRC